MRDIRKAMSDPWRGGVLPRTPNRRGHREDDRVLFEDPEGELAAL